MKKKITVLLIMISLSLTLTLMSNTYSRYVADSTSNIEATFSNWQILLNQTDITNQSSSNVKLTPVIDSNVNVAPNTIAPSSSGHFDIVIDPTNVGVSFNYSIELNLLNNDIPDLLISKYSILNTDLTVKVAETNIVDNKIMGTVDYSGTAHKAFIIRVFFTWYEGNNGEIAEIMTNSDDTRIGVEAAQNDTKLNIEADIKFEQKLS